jgi:hypothetical protein
MQFGASVALHGDSAMIGAPQSPGGAGSAHWFTRNGSGVWIHREEITGSDSASGDAFAGAVAFDGTTAALGARLDNTAGGADAGSVFVDAVTTGGGSIDVSNNGAAIGIDLGSLNHVGGTIDVSNNGAATGIDLGTLDHVGDSVDVSNNGAAIGIDLGSLNHVGGDVDVSSNGSATDIDLSSLESTGGGAARDSGTGGGLTIRGNTAATAVHTDVLAVVGGDLTMTDNTSLLGVLMPVLTQVDGSVWLAGNTSATTIDLPVLAGTGGGVEISGHAAAASLDLAALAAVGGDLTLVNNPLLGPIAFPALVSVGGNLTIETQAQSTVDLTGVSILGGLDLQTTDATSVLGDTPAGDTHLALGNGAAGMDLALPAGAIAAGTPFEVENIPAAALVTTTGLTADDGPARVDPVIAYHFAFGAAAPTAPAAVSFDLTLAELDAPEQAAVLAALESGELTVTVQSDAGGSVPVALAVCAPGEPLVPGGCATLTALDGAGEPLPPESLDDTAAVRFAALVTHFSTYALAVVTPTDRFDFDVDGDVDLADYATFAGCADGPGAPHDGSFSCNHADADADGDVDLADAAEFTRRFGL